MADNETHSGEPAAETAGAIAVDDGVDRRHCLFVHPDGGRCMGWQVRNTGHCAGHLRSQGKLATYRRKAPTATNLINRTLSEYSRWMRANRYSDDPKHWQIRADMLHTIAAIENNRNRAVIAAIAARKQFKDEDEWLKAISAASGRETRTPVIQEDSDE